MGGIVIEWGSNSVDKNLEDSAEPLHWGDVSEAMILFMWGKDVCSIGWLAFLLKSVYA